MTKKCQEISTPSRRKFLFGGLSFCAAVALAGCGRRSTSVSYSGATTLLPLISDAGAIFETQNPGVIIEISGGGSTKGILTTSTGKADLGGVARELTESETELVRGHPFAKDALAIVVHKDLPIHNVSIGWIKDVYTEGGENPDFKRIGKTPAHGTHQAFKNAIGVPGNLAADVVAGSNGEVLAYVASAKGIGYVSQVDAERSVAEGQPLRIVRVNGVLPSLKSLSNGNYPLYRTLYLVTPRRSEAPRNSAAKQFVDFLFSPMGQKIVEAAGFLPIAPNHPAQS